MEEILEIPIYYKGEHVCFEARVLSYSYNYKIVVYISDRQWVYEADEEGKYRAVAQSGSFQSGDKVDVSLLEAIAIVLDKQVKK